VTIYDLAVAVQIRLEAAQSADASGYLGAAAAKFVEAMDGVSGYLEGVAQFKARIPFNDSPSIDTESTSAAISKFRNELSRHGGEALQQDSASKLLTVAKKQYERAQGWANTRWEGLFSAIQPLLEEAAPERLVGNSAQVVGVSAKLSRLKRQDPVTNADDITEALCPGQPNASWTDRLRELGEDLDRALQQAKDSAAALAPEVQEALESAASEVGLSLSDLTAELLEQLRAAGVDDHLVVRRR
jgi:UDP-N-acetylmuramoylalanine-D-glutamate ligase